MPIRTQRNHESSSRHLILSLRVPRASQKSLLIGLGLLFLVVSVGFAWIVQQQHQAVSPFSASILQQVDFTLYYPAKLPGNLRTDPSSVRYGDHVVTFSISDKHGPNLAVSEQAVPNNFNFAKFYKDNVELPQYTDAPFGKETTGKLNGLPVCNLVTHTTWIIVNDPSGANSAYLSNICQGLRPAPIS